MTQYAHAAAKHLANLGRHGDTHLVHMSEEELGELAKIGQITINPKTGLPEAFSLGGIIRSLAGPAAGIITGNPWVGAAVGGAVGGFGGGGGFNPVGAITGGLGGYAGTSFGQSVIDNGFGATIGNIGSSIGDSLSSAGNWASSLWGGAGGGTAAGFSGFSTPGMSDMFSQAGSGMYDPDMLRKMTQLGLPGGNATDMLGGMAGPAGPMAPAGGITLPTTGGGAAPDASGPFTGARAVNTLSSLASGAYGLYNANQMRGMASGALNRADPWGASGGRAAADAQLQALLRNPTGAAQNDPAFQLRMQAAQRANAPMGTDSGAMAVAAANASTDWYNNRLQQLGGPAGANVNPGQASEIALQGTGMANNLAGQSLASIGFGVNQGTGGAMTPQQIQQLIQQLMQRGG